MAELSRREKVFVGMSKEDYLKIEHGLPIPPQFTQGDPVRLLIMDAQEHPDRDYWEDARKRASERYEVPIEKLRLYREVVTIEQIE